MKTITYFEETVTNVLDAIAAEMASSLNTARPDVDVILTIPAHNEERYISACIESVANQLDVYGSRVNFNTFEIIVLCHNCRDTTYEICKSLQKRYTELNLLVLETNRPEINNVGAVRRVLMGIAENRIAHDYGFIATTDADSIMHPYWLSNIRGYLSSDYALICGRIEPDISELSKNAKRILCFKQLYNQLNTELKDSMLPDDWDIAPRHADNSGPNLAVRANVYKEINGIRPIGFCEDIAFYDEIVWKGYKVRHCPLTIVLTSTRQNTRAPWGFGAELSTWNGSDTIYEVESLDALLTRFEIYRIIKNIQLTDDFSRLKDVSSKIAARGGLCDWPRAALVRATRRYRRRTPHRGESGRRPGTATPAGGLPRRAGLDR